MKSTVALLIVIVIGSSAFGQVNAAAPSECKAQDISVNGNPIMTPIRKHLALGISLSQHEFHAGDKIELHIWADNTGRNPIGVWTCADLGFFQGSVAVFGHDGQRIRSKSEINSCSFAKENSYAMTSMALCGRNFQINIPPHTCVTRNDFDFSTELTANYDLPPGEYSLRLQAREPDGTDMCKPQGNDPIHAHPNDLTFRVTKP
jgi:hypothetical protein